MSTVGNAHICEIYHCIHVCLELVSTAEFRNLGVFILEPMSILKSFSHEILLSALLSRHFKIISINIKLNIENFKHREILQIAKAYK